MAKMVALIGFLIILIALQSALLRAELTKLQHLPKNQGNLAILVVGDFGRKGAYNQSDVASQVFFFKFLHSTSIITFLS
jgi:tartrate-resistant acid phosphatase type 5